MLALIGSGVQARSHLKALPLVRDFREVRVWSPRHAEAFAREFGVRAASSAEAAVTGADVIVTATTSKTPVLRGEWLSPGAHINAVGAPRPDWRELDDEVLRRARLYVDSRAAAEQESGDVRAADEVVAELGEVAAGTKPGRQSADEITVFKSLGLAVEDVVSGDLVYRKAAQTGRRRSNRTAIPRKDGHQPAPALTRQITCHRAIIGTLQSPASPAGAAPSRRRRRRVTTRRGVLILPVSSVTTRRRCRRSGGRRTVTPARAR